MRGICKVNFDMHLLWSKIIWNYTEIHDIYDDNIEWPHQALAFLWCINCMKKKTPTSVLLLLSVNYHMAKSEFKLSFCNFLVFESAFHLFEDWIITSTGTLIYILSGPVLIGGGIMTALFSVEVRVCNPIKMQHILQNKSCRHFRTEFL